MEYQNRVVQIAPVQLQTHPVDTPAQRLLADRVIDLLGGTKRDRVDLPFLPEKIIMPVQIDHLTSNRSFLPIQSFLQMIQLDIGQLPVDAPPAPVRDRHSKPYGQQFPVQKMVLQS